MKQKKIKICDVYVHPGESANLALPLPEQYSCAPLYMPIRVIQGLKPGPCMVVFSVLKGTELNGLEITNRLSSQIDAKELAGTLISIPVVNVYGLTHYPRPLPASHDLARCFPGKEDGTYGERIAYLFTQEILKKADYCIELDTGGLNHNLLPQIYCNFDDKKGRALAKTFQAPMVTNVSLEGNQLRQTAEDLQVPLLVYQAGEAMRFDENAITLGVTGILNVMRHVDMLQKSPHKDVSPIFSKDEDWLTAHKGGILHPSLALGQTIKKKEVLGHISDPFGAQPTEAVRSQHEGIVVGINTSPLVYEGMPIFKIASFLDAEKAESVIEKWDKQQQDSFISG